MNTTPDSDRPIATSALATLGEIHPIFRPRDAVHIAVFSAKAGTTLTAGEKVVLTANAELIPAQDNMGIGIVDPFIGNTTPINKGDIVWVFLHPGRVTDVRHVWSDPEVDLCLARSDRLPEIEEHRANMRDRLAEKLRARREYKSELPK